MRPSQRFVKGVSEVGAVLRGARPVTAARWLAGLAIHTPEVARSGSLLPADRAWLRRGGRFRTPGGRTMLLPGGHIAGAREMYCRDVYLRTGLRIPAGGWVVDLGANAGLFTALAAMDGARVVAVEAQQGFTAEIRRLLALNQIDPNRVHIEIALAAGSPAATLVGVVADDEQWRTASHAAPRRPSRIGVPELMTRYRIDRIGLLKIDIEGSEFSVFDPASAPAWLPAVDQIAMEVHPAFGEVPRLAGLLSQQGFAVTVTDNDGRTVPARAAGAAYVYATQRPQHQ